MGKITLNKNGTLKTVDVIVDGSLELKQTLGYEADFKSLLKKIIPSEYSLTVQASSMSVANQEIQMVLKNLFLLYKAVKFKSIRFHTGNNMILKMQCNRIAKEVGLDVNIL